jgi:hypothetical protein
MPRKPLIYALLASYLLYVQGCTSRHLIPIEDIPRQADNEAKVISIEMIDGKILQIDAKTGVVTLVGDSLRVKCIALAPEFSIAVADVKQITVSEYDATKTGLLAFGSFVGVILGIVIVVTLVELQDFGPIL